MLQDKSLIGPVVIRVIGDQVGGDAMIDNELAAIEVVPDRVRTSVDNDIEHAVWVDVRAIGRELTTSV